MGRCALPDEQTQLVKFLNSMNIANLLLVLFRRPTHRQLTAHFYTASIIQDKDQDKQKYEVVIE